MYWTLSTEPAAPAPDAYKPEGRFVLHRHRDADGPHYDLRLEQEGYLLGWRIDGDALEGQPWATEKMPHPAQWLEQDGEAARADEGLYAWVERDADRRELILWGRQGDRTVRFTRETGLPPLAQRDIRRTLEEAGAAPARAAQLVADGLTARRRASERLCGLGRELDGEAFDEALWRKSIEGLSLDEIHAQLRAYELRFDLKYPPQPVSQPEPLSPEGETGRAADVLSILRDR
ncbi:MAG: hypothetical protein RBU21_06980 [FCB group bacterium]|jgi:hypothetical protein|nr:hypothetical protein [FCB group bacterium]